MVDLQICEQFVCLTYRAYLPVSVVRSVSSLAFVRFLFGWVCKHDLHLDAINHFTVQQCYGVMSRFAVCILYISHIPAGNQVNLHQGAETTVWTHTHTHTHTQLNTKNKSELFVTIVSNDTNELF